MCAFSILKVVGLEGAWLFIGSLTAKTFLGEFDVEASTICKLFNLVEVVFTNDHKVFAWVNLI